MNKLKIGKRIFLEKNDGKVSLNICDASKFLNVKVINISVNSDTDLIIEYDDIDKIKLDIYINVLKGVHLNIYELKIGGKYKSQYKYNLEESSKLNIEKVCDLNSNHEMTVINLNGDEASINYNLKTVCKSFEKYNFLVYHNANKTVSNIKNNGVNILDGTLEFNASSFVPKDIVKCNVSQSGRIINMTNNECVIKPNLFIDCDDVTANHSALIGTHSLEKIFYLMSRGIDKSEAERLLTKGFLMKDINYYKEDLEEIINKYWG